MIRVKDVLYAQYPALFFLALAFLVAFLIDRRRSAVKSVLWVVLFAASVAGCVLLAWLGGQAKLWTFKTLFSLSGWRWVGVALAALLVTLHIVHRLERRHSRRVMEKQLQKAEQEKELAVAQAREEAAQAAREEAAFVPPAQQPAPAPQEEPAPQEHFPMQPDAPDAPEAPAPESWN